MHETSQSAQTSNDDMLKQLTVPYSTLEPDLPPVELLKLDMLAHELEIKRLKDMGVLIPSETFEFGGETPKRLTTRMVCTSLSMVNMFGFVAPGTWPENLHGFCRTAKTFLALQVQC